MRKPHTTWVVTVVQDLELTGIGVGCDCISESMGPVGVAAIDHLPIALLVCSPCPHDTARLPKYGPDVELATQRLGYGDRNWYRHHKLLYNND